MATSAAARRSRSPPLRRATVAAGHHQQGVRGAHLAVDADAVERLGRRPGGHLLQVLGGDGGPDGEVGEHRRHVRGDHPGALGGGPDQDLAGAQRQAERAALGRPVGGADGLPEGGAAVGRQRGGGGVDAGPDPLQVDAVADRPRAADRDLLGQQAQPRRGAAGHGLGVVEPGGAGRGVRRAGVDDDGAQARAIEAAVADHRRRGQRVPRVDQGRGHGPVGGQDPEVERARPLQAAGDAARPEARRRRHRSARDRLEAIGRPQPVVAPDRGEPHPSRPSVSGRPAIRLRFCSAWPAAPLPRLSMTPKTVTRPPRGSTTGHTWA